MIEQNKMVAENVSKIADLMMGKPEDVQAATLTEAVAIWLLGYPAEHREHQLNTFNAAVLISLKTKHERDIDEMKRSTRQ